MFLILKSYISIPKIISQAKENGVSFTKELSTMAIHGALHLLGYNHEDILEEKTMFSKTDEILKRLFENNDNYDTMVKEITDIGNSTPAGGDPRDTAIREFGDAHLNKDNILALLKKLLTFSKTSS
mgnify:CR=1 FL=1